MAAKLGVEPMIILTEISKSYYFSFLHLNPDDHSQEALPPSITLQTYDFSKIAKIHQQKEQVEMIRLENAKKNQEQKQTEKEKLVSTGNKLKDALIKKLKEKEAISNYERNQIRGNHIDKANKGE